MSLAPEVLTNGDLGEEDEVAAAEIGSMDLSMTATVPVPGGGPVAMETAAAEEEKEAALPSLSMLAGVATPPAGQGGERLVAGGHPCSQCDRVFMSMQGLRSHERSHSAMALF